MFWDIVVYSGLFWANLWNMFCFLLRPGQSEYWGYGAFCQSRCYHLHEEYFLHIRFCAEPEVCSGSEYALTNSWTEPFSLWHRPRLLVRIYVLYFIFKNVLLIGRSFSRPFTAVVNWFHILNIYYILGFCFSKHLHLKKALPKMSTTIP